MGLDNGIILETKVPIRYKPWFTEFELTDEGVDDKDNKFYCYDLAYWRKCYGLRKCIFEVADISEDDTKIEYEIHKHEIRTIIELLFKINNKEEWANMETIWDYEESQMDRILFRQIGTLLWTYEWWNKRPQDIIRCYFYDSY